MEVYEESSRQNGQQSAIEVESVPRPTNDRTAVLHKFNNNLAALKAAASNAAALQQSKSITWEPHSSCKPLTALRPITFDQMKVPMVHKGKLLACRVLSEAAVTFAIEAICEDTAGEVQMVSLYNFNSQSDFSSSNTSKELLKPGMILLLKEPFMQYSTGFFGATNEPFIRVDSPSDVTFVHETEGDLLRLADALCWFRPETIPFESLKQMGNDAFKRKEFEVALAFYRRALAVKPESELIRLNMAAALLKMDRFYEADKFASEALAMRAADRGKAYFRLGMSAYGMRQWRKSVGYFHLALSECEGDSKSADALKKAEARLQESLTGEFDLKMLHDGEENGQLHFDLADYVGKVRVADVPRKGKGLVVTENVKKGTLLLASKAYVRFVSKNSNETKSTTLTGSSSFTSEHIEETQIRFISETAQNLKRNPQMAKQLYALFAGDSSIDRSEQAMPPSGVVDIIRIDAICRHNGSINLGYSTSGDVVGKAGLWLLPSFINHSCIGNAVHFCYGDMTFVYANQDLTKGDKILYSYLEDSMLYKKRAALLKERWCFECDCRLCQLDRADPAGEQQREELAKRIEEMQPDLVIHVDRMPSRETVAQLLATVQTILHQIRQTYEQQGRPKELCFALCKPLLILADLQILMRNDEMTKNAIEALQQVLEQQKVQGLTPKAVQTHWIIAQNFLLFNTPNAEMAKKWAEKAFNYAKSIAGIKEKELFLHIHPQFAKFYKKDGQAS